MNRLFELREWFTLNEAAKYLTQSLGHDVTTADLLRLALDRHLKLSVNLVNHAKARRGKIVRLADAKKALFDENAFPGIFQGYQFGEPLPPEIEARVQSGSLYWVLAGIRLDDDRYIDLDEIITSIDGVWDLPLIGAEELDVEHEYQMQTGGPEVSLISLNGAFVSRGGGEVYQLQESYKSPEMRALSKELERKHQNNDSVIHLPDDRHERARFRALKKAGKDSNSYFPAGGLPKDGVLVVRKKELDAFVLDQRVESVDKPVSTRERGTLLAIIAAMARELKLDLSEPYKAAEIIESITARHGSRVAANTIAGKIKLIAETVGSMSEK